MCRGGAAIKSRGAARSWSRSDSEDIVCNHKPCRLRQSWHTLSSCAQQRLVACTCRPESTYFTLTALAACGAPSAVCFLRSNPCVLGVCGMQTVIGTAPTSAHPGKCCRTPLQE